MLRTWTDDPTLCHSLDRVPPRALANQDSSPVRFDMTDVFGSDDECIKL